MIVQLVGILSIAAALLFFLLSFQIGLVAIMTTASVAGLRPSTPSQRPIPLITYPG